MKLLVYRVGKRKKSKNKSRIGSKNSVFGESGLGGIFKLENRGVKRNSTKMEDQLNLKYSGISRRNSYVHKQKLSFERFMFVTFIIAFTLLVVVQAALMSPTVRTFINGNDEFEGTPLDTEESLYEEGEIGIKLLNGIPDGHLKVLVNGDEAAVFNNSIINLKVMDGDIVEIDGSEANADSEVVIISKSDNISPESANKRVKLKSGVKRLTQVKID
jgi:hypothetical protein